MERAEKKTEAESAAIESLALLRSIRKSCRRIEIGGSFVAVGMKGYLTDLAAKKSNVLRQQSFEFLSQDPSANPFAPCFTDL
ncbi:unnamed protein product [Arabis nemorensis]|uniref:Uncharacterized protein n=1 Tax=Arabis nemorensis TaxID=586526 RepID=A0A565B8F4_9BRAS|nr:unnamed protein product [Arabis nemorensis]